MRFRSHADWFNHQANIARRERGSRFYVAVLWACIGTKNPVQGCTGSVYLEPGAYPDRCAAEVVAGVPCGSPMYRIGEFELEAA